jgi:hypothetical protein
MRLVKKDKYNLSNALLDTPMMRPAPLVLRAACFRDAEGQGW